MLIGVRDGVFVAKSIYAERHALKQAGFVWDKEKRAWVTHNPNVALRFPDWLTDKARRVIREGATARGKYPTIEASAQSGLSVPIFTDQQLAAAHNSLRLLASPSYPHHFSPDDATFGVSMARGNHLTQKQGAYAMTLVRRYARYLPAELVAETGVSVPNAEPA